MTIDVVLLSWARRALANGRAREIREAAHLSQTDLAAAVGVAAATLSRWEANERAPRGEPAVRYARLLQMLERSGSGAASETVEVTLPASEKVGR